MIGLNPTGTETLTPPSGVAIIVDSAGLSGFANSAEITDNRISMVGGEAIQQHGQGALIADNFIGRGTGGQALPGGVTGIRFYGFSVNGNEVIENAIENTEGNAILIENDNNLMIGNTIDESGAAGIRIQSFGGVLEANGNAIGGDLQAEENTISGSTGDAIEIAGPESTDNHVKRNVGAGNTGLFIDLGANGPGNPGTINGGILPPKIDGAKLTGASGSGALPGAEVRVFRKATASSGEIESFLGEAKADGSGNWTVTYAAAIPGETRIAATQSGLEGTSELAFATTEPAPSTGGGGSKDDKGGGKDDKGKDNKGGVPDTRITKGPRKTHATTVKFKFVSTEDGSKFECKLDRQKFKACKSPKKYKGLKPGKHVFKVRAVKGKNVDPTPAKRKFKILK